MPLPLPDPATLWGGAYAAGLLHLLGASPEAVGAVAAAAAVGSFVANRTHSLPLRDASVLVTGASSGLGRCIALEAARRGASHVVLVARNRERLETVAGEVRALGAEPLAEPCDVGDPEAVRSMAASVRRRLGGNAPLVVVNNAGAGEWRHAEADTAASLEHCMRVPAVAGMLVTREFVGDMVRRGRGHVVNVTSAASLVPFRGAVSYQTARMAVRGYSDALRADLRETGVGVTCLNAMELQGTEYFDRNPGSREQIPYLFSDRSPLFPLMRLTAEQAARAALSGVERGTREVYTPGVLSSLVPLQRWFPGLLEWTARVGAGSSRGPGGAK